MGTLYLIATPLGNLEDITLRAARILRQVDVVAAESRQRAGVLLRHLGIIPRRLMSCREANRKRAAEMICACLDQEQAVALISDAGSPGLNDPAAAMVRRVAAAGHTVSPIPGPSAVAAAWSVAGIDHAPFVVLGFLPAKSGPRQRLLRQCHDLGWPLVFFEAPHRLRASAADLAAFMPDRRLVLCREMSKLHEQILHLTCAELPARLETDPNLTKGELTLVVEGGAPAPASGQISGSLAQMVSISQGMGASQLAAFLAKNHQMPREALYREILALKNRD